MINCILRNIHTGGEIKYSFDVLPRIGETIAIDGIELRCNEEWQTFAGVDESDPDFEGFAVRIYQVCDVQYWISKQNKTSIALFLDEFYGQDI